MVATNGARELGQSSRPNLARLRKLPACFNAVATALIMSLLMTGIASALATWSSTGFSADLGQRWLATWGMSWSIGFPTALFVMPLVRRIVATLVEPAQASR
jgi:hypothetical protein